MITPFLGHQTSLAGGPVFGVHYSTIAVDNTLLDHDGTCIEDVGWFWDHAEERYKIAHDLLIANYVCSSGKHYPLEFRCFQKKEHC